MRAGYGVVGHSACFHKDVTKKCTKLVDTPVARGRWSGLNPTFKRSSVRPQLASSLSHASVGGTTTQGSPAVMEAVTTRTCPSHTTAPPQDLSTNSMGAGAHTRTMEGSVCCRIRCRHSVDATITKLRVPTGVEQAVVGWVGVGQ